LRIDSAALKAGVGLFALLWATLSIAATGAGTSSAMPATSATPTASQVPSIQILGKQTGLAGTCGGAGFDVNTFINIGTQASADVRLSAPGVGIVEQFVDETGKNIGPYNAQYPAFHIPAFGGGLAPNTLITLTITTYSAPGLTGAVTFTSTITFDCTAGLIKINPEAAANNVKVFMGLWVSHPDTVYRAILFNVAISMNGSNEVDHLGQSVISQYGAGGALYIWQQSPSIVQYGLVSDQVHSDLTAGGYVALRPPRGR